MVYGNTQTYEINYRFTFELSCTEQNRDNPEEYIAIAQECFDN